MTEENIILMLGLFLLSFVGSGFGCYYYFRKKAVDFTDEICRSVQEVLYQSQNGTKDRMEICRKEQGKQNRELHQNQDTLTSKAVMELEKLQNILSRQAAQSQSEKEEVQHIVSEISHQLKTPVSNIRMYQDMLDDADVSEAERKQFEGIIRQQLEKLEFVVESLIHASRLEREMIHLNPEEAPVFPTLAKAVSAVAAKAERKKIELRVDCPQSVKVCHDVKWTAEAVENLLDNAVKYTPERGTVSVSVKEGEMYTGIQIEDTGKGILSEHYNDIFKRFYREKTAGKEEGLGLGLYLARRIITLQGGYIMVGSRPGKFYYRIKEKRRYEKMYQF